VLAGLYYLVLEGLWGRTVGKFLTGIRERIGARFWSMLIGT